MSEVQTPYGTEKAKLLTEPTALPDLRGLWNFQVDVVDWSGDLGETVIATDGVRVTIEQFENSFSFVVDRGTQSRVIYVGEIRGATFTLKAEWNDSDVGYPFDAFRTVNGGGDIEGNVLRGAYTLERQWRDSSGVPGACTAQVTFSLTRMETNL